MNKDSFKIIDKTTFIRAQKEIDKERKALLKEYKKIKKEITKKSKSKSKIAFLQDKKDARIDELNAQYNEVCDKLKAIAIRQEELNQARKENNKKTLKLVGILFSGVAVLIVFCVIIGQVKSSHEVERTTFAEYTTISQMSNTTTTTTTTTTEPTTIDDLEEIELTSFYENWSVEVGETDDYITYSADTFLTLDDLDEYELVANVDNEKVLKASVNASSYDDIHVVITGLKPGDATVTITGKDNKVSSEPVVIKVEDPETEKETETKTTKANEPVAQEYVLNTSTKKIHYPWCSSINSMSARNKKEVYGILQEFIDQDYQPCGRCNPH